MVQPTWAVCSTGPISQSIDSQQFGVLSYLLGQDSCHVSEADDLPASISLVLDHRCVPPYPARYFLEKNQSVGASNDWFKSFHINFIYNNPSLESTQVSSNSITK